jgi:hypothetical protein
LSLDSSLIFFASLKNSLASLFEITFYDHAAKWQTDLLGLVIPFQEPGQTGGSLIITAKTSAILMEDLLHIWEML